MNKRFVIIIVLAFLFVRASAQSDFVKGYVLVTEKDTLKGEIDNVSYFSNSQYCDFRYNESDPVKRFYPQKIFGYRFNNGKYYVSREISINDTITQVFMEYLVHGRLDLYFFQDRGNYNHYYISKDSLNLSELVHVKEYVEKDGTQMLHETRPYVGLLTYFTSDCEAIKKDISGLKELYQPNLITIAEKYHNLTCPGQKCIVYEKKLPRKMKFNIYGGSVYYLPYRYYGDLYGEDKTKRFTQSDYGFNFLFQYTQRSEKVYLGIGLIRATGLEGLIMNGYQIPLSINYLNPRKGLSPIISFELDANTVAASQALRAGFKYQINKTALYLTGSLNTSTEIFVKLIATSVNFGLMVDLN